uniref:Uncharacterized protein n=1 Tax=Chromera velia CCMP2878 TaxID=1169474 RepID=A0A0G4I7U8_9ALVE|eukprot:Cvel_11680.t1-p1 / transcript=Cvel_11680.t1 / gene=Cvel_11680 / organism=Chromera_velia_CCMP2878 / gene_product=hypothetical protein / transcript_product=hypothetical protein / location=Cvel_scaffold740:47407-51933(+) / protein_length=186 / sequence_SO=supercontig / SO=protein_coding / is_pseudo=false
MHSSPSDWGSLVSIFTGILEGVRPFRMRTPEKLCEAQQRFIEQGWEQRQDFITILKTGVAHINLPLGIQKALTRAICAQNYPAVNLLLYVGGTNLSSLNYHGTPPIILALHLRHWPIAGLLAIRGAAVNVLDRFKLGWLDATGLSPLHLVPFTEMALLNRLLEKGADINILGTYGQKYTPLLFCIQ